MDRKNITLVLLAWLFLVLTIIPSTEAITLGSAMDKKTIQASPGDSITFKLLFFNIHENSALQLQLESECPHGWNVVIEPAIIDLPLRELGDLTPEEGYEFLGTAKGDVKAKPVRIRVDIPDSAQPGNYRLKVSASVGKGGGVLSTSQIRNFYFDISLILPAIKNKQNNQSNDENTGNEITETTRNNTIEYKIPGNETKETENKTYGKILKKPAPQGKEPDNETIPPAPDLLGGITGMIFSANSHTFLIVFTVIIIVLCWIYYKRD